MDDRKPLIIFMDTECTGSGYFEDIIELAAAADPRITISKFTRFGSLINTTQQLSKFVTRTCKISKSMLAEKQYFPVVFERFILWIERLIHTLNKKHKQNYFPVLVSHGGMRNDFLHLVKNIINHDMDIQRFREKDLFIADTYELCCKIRSQGLWRMESIKLSMAGLFEEFCKGSKYQHMHRAMGDVNAMITLFIKSPLVEVINQLDIYPFALSFETFEKNTKIQLTRDVLKGALPKMSLADSNITLKKLLRHRYDLDSLKELYRNCTSPHDFFMEMEKCLIKRKVARCILRSFQASGIHCRGAISIKKEQSASFLLQNILCGKTEFTLLQPSSDVLKNESLKRVEQNIKGECVRTTMSCCSCVDYSFINRTDSGHHSNLGEEEQTLSFDDESYLLAPSKFDRSSLMFGGFDISDPLIRKCERAVSFKEENLNFCLRREEKDITVKDTNTTTDERETLGCSIRETLCKQDHSTCAWDESIPSNDLEKCWDDENYDCKPFKINIEKHVGFGLKTSDVFYDDFKAAPFNIPLPRGLAKETY